MARQTSVEAYRAVRDCGWIAKTQKQIYEVVYESGPMTSGECFWEMHGGKPQRAISQSRARFTELREMGLLAEVGKRECAVTGRRVILWDVTTKAPVKRRNSTKAKLKRQIKETRAKLRDLEHKLRELELPGQEEWPF